MQYTVETFPDGLAFFGDPSWNHVVGVMHATFSEQTEATTPVLGYPRHLEVLDKLQGRPPALVVCWSEEARQTWLFSLEAELLARSEES